LISGRISLAGDSLPDLAGEGSAEAALSHAIGTEVCRRYDRATVHRNLLKHRRPLMAWWCGVLDGNSLTDPEDGEIGNVIPLTRVA
jgi:hypothetical protein